MRYLRILVSVQYHTYLEGALLYTSKKSDVDIQSVFQTCVCGEAAPQFRRLLPKKWKVSFKECWVHTHISFRNTAQLRLRIFCVCVFQSFFETVKCCINGSGFCKCISIFLMRTVCLIIMEEDLLRFFSPQSCPSWTWSTTSLQERSWPAYWTASPSWQVSYIKMSHLAARCPDLRGRFVWSWDLVAWA